MKVTQAMFGELAGREVTSFTLENANGMKVTCLTYGCIITDIIVPDKNGAFENVVLGFDRVEEYVKDSPYFGAVIGRVAGRIAEGRFELSGAEYKVTQNEGTNHLHGGSKGFNNVIWDARVEKTAEEAKVIFSYTSPDGEEGYPGTLQVTTTYTLNNDNELIISYSGISDQATLLNMTNHTYFNLSGNVKRDVLDHTLTLNSHAFLELNEKLLPTGTVLPVEGTVFNFRNGRRIRDGINSQDAQNILASNGYDHPFLLDVHFQKEIVLKDEVSGRQLTIETDQPSVVLYSGNQLGDDFVIRGVQSRRYLGLCLETQGLPDAIHHPNFPSILLEKEEEYKAVTKYIFTTLQ